MAQINVVCLLEANITDVLWYAFMPCCRCSLCCWKHHPHLYRAATHYYYSLSINPSQYFLKKIISSESEEKCSWSSSWHLPMSCFVRSGAHNPNMFSFLSYMTQKALNSSTSEFFKWQRTMPFSKYLLFSFYIFSYVLHIWSLYRDSAIRL